MVSVSLNPSAFLPITAIINGMIAGLLYLLSLQIFKVMKLDDTTHSSNVHGISAAYALLSICFFHKDEGFFFKDIYLDYIDQDTTIAPIILVLGSNSLASFAVGLLCTFMCFVVFRLIMSSIMRVSKVQEIIGQDVYYLFTISDRVLSNHIFGVINAFYPDPTGEFALKKQKLLTGGGLSSGSRQDKSEKKGAYLSLTQLNEMKDIIDS